MTDKGKSVLIAEDSSVISDIVKLFLTRQGHSVTIATDGPETLDKLLSGAFDVALIDYHLPGLDGVELVRRFVDAAVGKRIPRLLAMTADTKGFLAAGRTIELFEQVLPKPIDIDTLVSIIAADGAGPTDRVVSPGVRDASRDSGENRPFAELDRYILYFPNDFDAEGLRRTQMRLKLEGPPDAILLLRNPDPASSRAMFSLPTLHLSPVVDLTSGQFGRADLGGRNQDVHAERLTRIIDEFRNRRERIHPDFNEPADIDERILARAYASGGAIEPRFNPDDLKTVVYSLLADPDAVEQTAARLEKDGLVTATFFDRLQVCPGCRGSRLMVREICSACGSAHLHEESYVHHFKCAYQGPETDFRHGDDLLCPKCRRELTSFGVDYDRPGVVLVCKACGASMSDPGVSFRCLDCGQITTGETIHTRDILSYALSPRGRDVIETGRMGRSTFGRIFRFSELPIQIIAQLNRFASTHGEQAPFGLAVISYPNLRQMERDHGAGFVDRTRRNLLRRAVELVNPDIHASGSSSDYLLANEADAGDLRARAEAALKQAATESAVDLEPRCEILTARDIF
ncbi:MAG: response regulator [Rhodobacteraceae bacterium]|jgi:CheY-like chemotaxis protein|nr:response regulator [Paracoccaceae bacterium]